MRALCLAILGSFVLGCGSDDASVALDVNAKPKERANVRVFYSGHSLTDGIPEAIASISKPGAIEYKVQSMVGSTIRQRSEANDGNRPGPGYDVLVITERHDLPWTIEHEQTVPLLRDYAAAFLAANPTGDVLLYHGWLELNGGPVTDWIDYERDALPLWECVASAVNQGRQGRVRVLPGATVLGALVEGMVKGEVPGVGGSIEDKLALIFSDTVHLAPAGHYFMSLVHYAALFGASPEGVAAPAGVSPELAKYMQQLAWQHVSEYAQRASSAAARDLAWCNDYASDVMCPRYYQYRKPVGGSLLDRAKHMKNALFCGQSPAFR